MFEERCRLQMPRVGDNSRVIQADPANGDLCNLNRVETGQPFPLTSSLPFVSQTAESGQKQCT